LRDRRRDYDGRSARTNSVQYCEYFRPGGAYGGLPSRALDAATFAAYTGCFRTMAIVTAVILPGIFLFRIMRPDAALPTAV
jgi:hypothetical protein